MQVGTKWFSHSRPNYVLLAVKGLKFLNPFGWYLHEALAAPPPRNFGGKRECYSISTSEEQGWPGDLIPLSLSGREPVTAAPVFFHPFCSLSQQWPWITSRKNRGRFWREMRAVRGRREGLAYARGSIKPRAKCSSKIEKSGGKKESKSIFTEEQVWEVCVSLYLYCGCCRERFIRKHLWALALLCTGNACRNCLAFTLLRS